MQTSLPTSISNQGGNGHGGSGGITLDKQRNGVSLNRHFKVMSGFNILRSQRSQACRAKQCRAMWRMVGEPELAWEQHCVSISLLSPVVIDGETEYSLAHHISKSNQL